MIRVTRTITWVYSVPESAYPDMTPDEAVRYEESLALEEYIEALLDQEPTTIKTSAEVL